MTPHRIMCLSQPSRRAAAPFWSLLVLAWLLWPPPSAGAAACVVAKKLGTSLAVEWVAVEGDAVNGAIEVAMGRLRDQGFGRERHQDMFPQANTPLAHAYGAIVRTEYPNGRGRSRVSYGCGFSAESAAAAEQAALADLQTYSWGWTPEKGYEVTERFRY